MLDRCQILGVPVCAWLDDFADDFVCIAVGLYWFGFLVWFVDGVVLIVVLLGLSVWCGLHK